MSPPNPPGPAGPPCPVCGMSPWVYMCRPDRCMNPDPSYASYMYRVGDRIHVGDAVGVDKRGLLAPARIGMEPMATAHCDAAPAEVVATQNGKMRAATDEEKALAKHIECTIGFVNPPEGT